jgi:dienelactone hydrolase
MKDYQHIALPVNDYVIAGDWYNGVNKHSAILLMHGYPSVKANQVQLAAKFVKSTGLGVLTFDYSGLGESPYNIEQTTASQHLNDAIACYDWLINKGFKNIICIGMSYGGYLAAHLWQYRPINHLILRAPAINPEAYFNYPRSKYNRNQQMILRNNPAALAKHPLIIQCSKYTGKSLVMVHGKDEAIPKPTTNAYIKALKSDYYIQEGLYHTLDNPNNSKKDIPEYIKAITGWINKSISA